MWFIKAFIIFITVVSLIIFFWALFDEKIKPKIKNSNNRFVKFFYSFYYENILVKISVVLLLSIIGISLHFFDEWYLTGSKPISMFMNELLDSGLSISSFLEIIFIGIVMSLMGLLFISVITVVVFVMYYYMAKIHIYLSMTLIEKVVFKNSMPLIIFYIVLFTCFVLAIYMNISIPPHLKID